MARNIVVLGGQWGDEGKGKVVDWFAPMADTVVRFQGGHNAGHTLVVNGKKTALNLIPSGALHTDKTCVIGNGVVVSVSVLLKEIDMLAQQGVDLTNRLLVSENCPLLLPTHVALDQAREKKLGKSAIGTTGRGIGPVYEDKIARRGLRLIDIYQLDSFKIKLKELLAYHNFLLSEYYQVDSFDFEVILKELMDAAQRLKPFLCDVTNWLHDYRLKQENRQKFFTFSQEANIPCVIISCFAPQATLEKNIEKRKNHPNNVSDATLLILKQQLLNHDPLSEDEKTHALIINTKNHLDIENHISAVKNLLAKTQTSLCS